MNGLKLFEPKSFLSLENYAFSLAHALPTTAVALFAFGLALLLLGYPLRRWSSALLFAAAFWTVGGSFAMVEHKTFFLWSSVPALMALLLGLWLPRLAMASFAAVLLALLGRLLALSIDPSNDTVLLVTASTFVVFFFTGLLAYIAANVFVTSAVGAFVCLFSVPAVFPNALLTPAVAVNEAPIFGALTVLVTLFGMFVQLRLGEFHWSRVKSWINSLRAAVTQRFSKGASAPPKVQKEK